MQGFGGVGARLGVSSSGLGVWNVRLRPKASGLKVYRVWGRSLTGHNYWDKNIWSAERLSP